MTAAERGSGRLGKGTLAALKVAVVVMGILIVSGMAVLAVTMAHRLSGGAPSAAGSLLLDEPSGTSVAGVALAGDRLALQLRGGGPDRVVVVDLRSGGVPARVALAR